MSLKCNFLTLSYIALEVKSNFKNYILDTQVLKIEKIWLVYSSFF